MSYGSSPANVELLSKTVFALIDSMQTQGPTPSDLAKVREQIIREREVELKSNSWWLSAITTRDQYGEDIAGITDPYDDMVRTLTAAQIREAAKKYFNVTNYARFVLLPEKT